MYIGCTCLFCFSGAVTESVFNIRSFVTGLRYEDLLNDSEKEVAEALELADPEVRIGRNRRIKRALDLSMKRKNLQDYAPGMQLDVFKVELYDDVKKIKARDQEYAMLNIHNK